MRHVGKTRFRFRLRTLLLVCTVLAVAMAVWRSRPDPQLSLQVTGSGIIVMDGAELELASLPDALWWEQQARKVWFARREVAIRADADVDVRDVERLISLCVAAGFDRFVLGTIPEDRTVLGEQD